MTVQNGIPLFALEIREEYLKNQAADIVKVKGTERMPVVTFSDFHNNHQSFLT